MLVRVKLFATLGRYAKENLPGVPFEIELPENASIQDLITELKIPPEETRIVFVNGIVQSNDWVLNPDDEVGIFPPIGGGEWKR